MSESDVPRETDDEQTERHAEGFTPTDARLMADLQRIYDPLAASNARSLERVQARLEEHEARLSRSRSEPLPLQSFPSRLPPKERTMKSSRPIFSRGSTLREVISAVAACLVLAVLVGSMVTVFTLTQQGKGATHPGQGNTHPGLSNNANPTAQSDVPTPTEAPTPPAAPGVYIDWQTGDDGWNDYQIAKIDPQTRGVLWKQDVGELTSPPIVYGNTVYVASGDPTGATFDTYVLALDASSGAVRWKVTFPANIGPNDNYPILNVLDTPTLYNGTIYIGDRSGKLYALNATTGARLWTYSALASPLIFSPVTNGYTTYDPNPAAAANGVVYDSIYNELYAVNTRTGKQLWMKKIDDTQLFTTPVLANGVVYITSAGPGNASTYAYATKDGKLLWKDPIGSSNPSLTVEQGTVYLGADMLYALRASDGSPLWYFNSGESSGDQPILANGLVYVDGAGTGVATVFAVNAASGKLVWQKPVENLARLWAVQDGVVYLGVQPGQVYTLSAKDGSVLWHQRFGPVLIDKTGRESESAPNITVVG